MSEFRVEPFTNEFGQVINPGDEVVYVATGYAHQVSVNRGTFEGVRYDKQTKYYPVLDEDGNPVMEERYGYMHPKREARVEMVPVSVRLNNVPKGYKYEYVWNEKLQREVLTKTDKQIIGRTTLPRKRIYKIDTSVINFVGSTL